jgi:hypothetical protein
MTINNTLLIFLKGILLTENITAKLALFCASALKSTPDDKFLSTPPGKKCKGVCRICSATVKLTLT